VATKSYIVGDVTGRNCMVFDDEIATGGSLIETTKTILNAGAREIYAGAIHPVLCGDAVERIQASPLKEVVVTNTIPVQTAPGSKIVVLSVAHIFGEAIARIHHGESVSALFEKHY
jgi:ribose-phosphate pyrophosphokinase